MNEESEVWVVVCQNDHAHPTLGVDPDGPLVHEQYTRGATREAAMQRAGQLEQWGACRIARLVFDDPLQAYGATGPRPSDLLDIMLQWRNAERDADPLELANAKRNRDDALRQLGR